MTPWRWIATVMMMTAVYVAMWATAPTRGQAEDNTNAAAADVVMQRDIVYGRGGDEALRLNLSRPVDLPKDTALPCVVVIHGGGWRSGDRGGLHDALLNTLARRGYIAVSISYRFAPKYRFPAQVEDAKCAVRYLRAHAGELNIDPQRIGAIGFSAGAHLAMMLGTMDIADGLEGDGGWADHSSKVQAVVAFFGPTDLTARVPDASRHIIEDFIGGTQAEKRDVYHRASPVAYVDEGDAPMLLFHGTRDQLVPYEHAIFMAEALHKANVPGRVELLIGKDHGWLDWELPRTLDQSWAFFDRYLK